MKLTNMESNEARPTRLEYMPLDHWIREHWQDCVRSTPENEGVYLALPVPYVVPCAESDGMFRELFYWDTFYTNEGLLSHGREDLARNNVECLMDLVDRYGYVPNASRVECVCRSQPPHLALMVESIFQRSGDRDWLASALPRVERELAFWTSVRGTPCGLSAYGEHGGESDWRFVFGDLQRLRFPNEVLPADQWAEIGADAIASSESGWDFTPRFDWDCRSVCPVDLNMLLAASERLIGQWREILELPGAHAWQAASLRRQQCINELCWDASLSTWLDWDWKRGIRRNVPSAAAAYVLWLGDACSAKAHLWIEKALPRLIGKGGVAACEPGQSSAREYQWAAPNAWAPLQYSVVHGLLRAGRTDLAADLTSRWCQAVLKGFVETGRLWEKYNALTGGTDVIDEYEMPPLMGWTAGVFANFVDLESKLQE